jgi:hypothetical protein
MKRCCFLFQLCFVLVVSATNFAQTNVTTKPEAWREDLRYFAAEMPRRHVNFFHDVTPAAFAQAVSELEATIPFKSDGEIQAGFFRLTAMAKETHTYINWSVNGAVPYFRRLPIWMQWFKEGLYLTNVSYLTETSGRSGKLNYRRVVGARLVKVGETDIEQVIQLVRQMIPHENEYWLRTQLPYYVITPEILKEAGVVADMERVRLTFAHADGQLLTISPPLVSWNAAIPWMANINRKELPLYRQSTNVNYWYKGLDDGRTLWMQYNRCQDIVSNPMTNFANDMFQAADANGATRFVLDLRNNPGGNSEVIRPVIAALRNRPWLNQRGRLYVIIGNFTASSGLLCARDFRNQTNAILLGEPTGGKPNGYGEILNIMLPNSRLICWYSTKYFNLVPGDPAALFPDVTIETGATDYLNHEDPLLSYLLSN